jgi:hypothetical protein
MNRPTVACVASLLLPLTLSQALPAQDEVAFSFDGGWLASGRTREGDPTSPRSRVVLKIDGFPEVYVTVPRSATAGDMAQLSMTALGAAGFNMRYEPPSTVIVVGHTSGQPIRGGAAIGTDDDDMNGLDLGVTHSGVAGQSNLAPPPDGCGIPRPRGNTPSQGGLLRVTIELAGVPVPLVVQTGAAPGTMPQQIDAMLQQALQQQGIVARPWLVDDPLVQGATLPMLGLLTGFGGRRVTHVQVETTIETEIVAMHLVSCEPIKVGVQPYGWSFPGPQSPRLDSRSWPVIGSAIQVEMDTGIANAFGGVLIGFQEWALPLPQLLAGGPATGNPPTLFVNPVGSPLTAFADGQGVLRQSLFVPGLPEFIGTRLCWQGFDLGGIAPATVRLSNGLMTNVGG